MSDENNDAPDLKKTRRQRPRTDRLPPYSDEAERGLLGSILLDPLLVIPLAEEQLKPEAFYDLRHKAIYDCILAMQERFEAIDTLTLSNRLKDAGQLEAVGGIPYLNELPDATPSAHHAEEYVRIIYEKHTLRRIIQTCTEAVGLAYAGGNEPEEVLDSLERDVLSIAQDRVKGGADINSLVIDAMEAIEQYHGGGLMIGLPTGFRDFDKFTGGLQPGEMTVIAARPSVGKTSLAMNVAEFLAVDGNVPVGVMSLEMTAPTLVRRLIASRARVNLRSIAEGFMSERDVPRLISAAAKIKTAPLFIDDASGMTILQLKAKSRRLKQRHGIKLLLVDYLQLITAPSRRFDSNRQQEVAEVSKGLKLLAKELNIPVVVLSQLNRLLDREKRKPVLSDLRESGAIEQDADVVAFLHRVKAEDGEPVHYDAKPIDLILAKQRNGPSDVAIHLTFLRSVTRFESAAKISAVDREPKERQTTWGTEI